MAEAHQGVAFTFSVTEDEGLDVNVSLEAFKAVVFSGMRSWRKRLAWLLNRILNGCYPSHPLRGISFVCIVSSLKYYKNLDVSYGLVPLIEQKIPRNWFSGRKGELAACALFAGGTWLAIVSVRRNLLKALFTYHGWMYESRGKINIRTKLWAVATKSLLGSKPKLYSYQNSLPYLPVPALKETLRRYLRTIRPLYDDEKYERIQKEALDFQKTIGPRLQRYLVFKSLISSNYVSDWWEEYVYLRGRSPIMVNSNYYVLGSFYELGSYNQAARAANNICAIFMYRRELDNETLAPIMLQNTIPLCSRQYERQFNTTRVPGEISDKLVHYKDSKHVAVYSRGKWYKLYAYYQSTPLNAKELEGQIQKILDDDSEASKGEKYLASLTAADRVPWAQARSKYFSRGVNKASLMAIEKAAFVVILDEEEYDHSPTDHTKLDNYAHAMLHGKGHDRWFDKSFNMIIAKNGRIGLNVEHSWADGPIIGHLFEYIGADEYFKIGYDEKGHSKGKIRFEQLPEPTKLRWEFNAKIEEAIMSSYEVAAKLLNDVDLHICIHDEFGKAAIKICKTSPDAFIQLALQLAYFRDIGKNHLTYEASMTRLFREGRTETVRSCSVETCEWVQSMVNTSATITERIRLFQKACDFHQQQYRDAMTGKGVDRHLFCLYVVSKYLELDTPFLKEVLSEPWRLSTSQTPTAQTDKVDYQKYPHFVCPAGGFGPVADDGYGVSYIIAGEDHIFFHVSSKKSSSVTDSLRFAKNIKRAMMDIKDLFIHVNQQTIDRESVTS